MQAKRVTIVRFSAAPSFTVLHSFGILLLLVLLSRTKQEPPISRSAVRIRPGTLNQIGEIDTPSQRRGRFRNLPRLLIYSV